jgi:hypothetical protein
VTNSYETRVAVAAAFFAASLSAHVARADLREVSDRVERDWSRSGASVTHAATHFLYEDETMTVTVPPLPTDEDSSACMTIALIGARGVSFHAKVSGTVDDPLLDESGRHATSVAGLLSIERCGGAPIHALSVTSDAGRGAIETLVGRSHDPLPPLRIIVPERTGGILPQTPEPGALPPLPPQEKRVEIAEARSRRDGATIEDRTNFQAGIDGAGDGRIPLAAGCHRIELFAPSLRADLVARKIRIDVDAELRDEETDELLARDRTDAADARLDACVGKPTAARIVFAGSLPMSKIATTHASWPMPSELPRTWGSLALGRMATALHARNISSPTSPPILRKAHQV